MASDRTEATQRRVRQSARILLLDTDDRVLLFHETDPRNADETFWFTPGGGLEPGEEWEDAARRELWEETGVALTTLGQCVWTRTHVWTFQGQWIESRERFYLVRAEPFILAPGSLEPWEEASVAAHRWWSLGEIEAASHEVFVPRRLAHFLAPLLVGDLPASPIDVGV